MVQVHFLTLVQDCRHFHGFLFGFEPVDGLSGTDRIGQLGPTDHTEVHGFVVVFGGVGFRFHHALDSTGSSRFGNHAGNT